MEEDNVISRSRKRGFVEIGCEVANGVVESRYISFAARDDERLNRCIEGIETAAHSSLNQLSLEHSSATPDAQSSIELPTAKIKLQQLDRPGIILPPPAIN